ncbi:MAG TPA: cytochrome ubiquinol oxidase subunit I [Phototrophicaceae bacterium]|nr:cytochrome ubiquinol oxidase subunit I [Phototrophicaceae bacterium]
MDSLTLARLQFGITTVYHFFFVPLSLGLSLIVALLETRYVMTGDDKYKQMAKFWGRLFIINFAMGTVTGIVQEFQFGMNWSQYSRFVGDVFGAPLAIEALAAFFIESTFLGLWIFGWDRLGRKTHAATIWLVALAANLSAFWILVANSFMQHPVGYTMVNGHAEMSDFFALITNPNVLLQFPHVALGGITTGSFFVLGISAWHLLRGKSAHLDWFRTTARWGLIIGTVAVLATMFFGDAQGQRMEQVQPMKLAAAEGLWNSEDPAGLSFFQIGDEQNHSSIINIRIPDLLSLLTYHTANGKVQGLNDLQQQYEQQYGPGDYIPPAIWLTYWSFRAMVGSGMLMFLLGIVGLVLFYLKHFEIGRGRWLLRILIAAIILPYLANSTGWILTEVGRQPWIVQGLMQTDQAISPNVTPAMLLITLIGFTLIYGLLMIADIYLLQKSARRDDDKLIPWADQPEPTQRLEQAY